MSILVILLLSWFAASSTMPVLASDQFNLPGVRVGVGGINAGIGNGGASINTPAANVRVGGGGGGTGMGVGIGVGVGGGSPGAGVGNFGAGVRPPMPMPQPVFSTPQMNLPQAQHPFNRFTLINDVSATAQRFITPSSQSEVVKAPSGHNIVVQKGAEVLVTQDGDRLRVQNLTGIGKAVRLEVSGPGGEKQIVNLDPGTELVTAKAALTQDDLRPADGIARRNTRVSGNIGISEIHLPNVLGTNRALSRIVTNPGSRAEKRLGDRILKTAAAILTLRGLDGFEITPPGQGQPLVPGGQPGGPPEPPLVAESPPVVATAAATQQTAATSAAASQVSEQSRTITLPQATGATIYDQTRTLISTRSKEQVDRARRIAATSRKNRDSDVRDRQPAARQPLSPSVEAAGSSDRTKAIASAPLPYLSPQSASTTSHTMPASQVVRKPVTAGSVIAELRQKVAEDVRQHPLVAFALILLFGIMLVVMTMLAAVAHRRAAELQRANLMLNKQMAERLKAEQEVASLNRGLQAKVAELNELTDELTATRDRAVEASRLKSEFVANISHEIRTPISAVLGMIGLLKASDVDEKQAELVQMAEESARSLLTVINDILDFSKIEAGMLLIQSVDFSIPAVVKEVRDVLVASAQEKGLNLLLNVDADVPKLVHGDPFRLKQVLLNLVGNAIKFTASGTVSLSVQSQSNDHEIGFFVQDSGIGIPEDVRPRLFQPFSQADGSTTRRFGGTGLGLSISKRLVDLMGGQIGFSSESGKGSKFWFVIPFASVVSHAVPSNVPASSTERALPPGNRRILVAEDSPVLQRIVKQQLASLQYDPVIVSNGLEAVERMKNERFDMVLMDWQMPQLDGIQATKQIRELPECANVPIIAMTANAMEGDRTSCLEAGMNDYISKPFTLEQLTRVIAIWMPETNSTQSS